MLFEIVGKDNQKILEYLKIFKEEAEKEYKESIPKAKSIIKKIQAISPTRVDIDSILPESIVMLTYEQDGKVYLRIGLYTPIVVKLMGRVRSMTKNLKKYLKEKEIDVEVKYCGD